ncbi:MAG: dihydroorotase [Pseudomonadota bacterium]
MTEILTIRRPDDWHLHLRDGAMLEGIVGETTRHFGRAIIMPNLVPPVVTGSDAVAYRERIMRAASTQERGDLFEPLMTLYLTEETDPEDVRAAAGDGLIRAVKLYPAGATTNSQSGVRDFDKVMPVLETMADIGLRLCVHGEVTDHEVDIFDREKVFIDTKLEDIRQRVPELKVTMEHVTTKDGVDYIAAAEQNLCGSITTHHLIINRNHLLVGGIRPHYYCLPVAKREEHRQALRKAATSGDPRYFLGTDSAPHPTDAKECACGCAGVFTATNTMACLAHVFEQEDALDRLEGFSSLHGPAAYGLEPNDDLITLVRSESAVEYPKAIKTDAGPVIVFDPGFPLHWQVQGDG